jgi:outer membrane lipoprotein-sorting protein
MIAALIAAVLLQDTAADFLKKVEEKYASAKTFSASAEIRLISKKDGKEVTGEMKGTIRAKGEGMARLEVSGSMGGREVPRTGFISDSRRLAIVVQGGQPQQKEQKVPFGAWARRFHIRVGLAGSIGAFVATGMAPDAVKIETLFAVSEITDEGRETVSGRECRIIASTVSNPDPKGPPMKCRLWIDPLKLVVMKREVSIPGAKDLGSVAETYADIVFDADMPDDVFKIAD